MNKIFKQFFDLIKSSLNNEIFKEDIIDELSIYNISLENGLSGTIFKSLDQDKTSPEIYNKFEKTFYNFYMKDVLQNREINDINNLLNQANIDHIFLKGSFLKGIYPASYMRSMGDVDVLINPHDLFKISEVMLNGGFKHCLTNESHDCYLSENKGLIEIHTRLNNEDIDRYDEFLEMTWENIHKVDHNRYELDLEYNLVYLLIHMVKHFNSSGIGIRSVLDIGLFINKYASDISLDKLFVFLNQCDLELFFKNIVWLNQVYFGFDFEFIINDFKQDDEFLNDITNFIIKSGVHGRGSDFNRFTSKMTHYARQNDNIKKGKLIYIIEVIFPSCKDMRYTYHYLKKFPFLLPIAWITRWCRLLFKKTRASFSKIRKLFVKKDNIEEVIKLYEKLGV